MIFFIKFSLIAPKPPFNLLNNLFVPSNQPTFLSKSKRIRSLLEPIDLAHVSNVFFPFPRMLDDDAEIAIWEYASHLVATVLELGLEVGGGTSARWWLPEEPTIV